MHVMSFFYCVLLLQHKSLHGQGHVFATKLSSCHILEAHKIFAECVHMFKFKSNMLSSVYPRGYCICQGNASAPKKYNDFYNFKSQKLRFSRTFPASQLELASQLKGIRKSTGSEFIQVLPRLPIHAATMLNQTMAKIVNLKRKTFVIYSQWTIYTYQKSQC